jgi:hypothetical protein
MLTNVISNFSVAHYGALNVISWKYTFKKLNEEYEIANKKKQALENLYQTGKISQATKDSFAGDIESAIVEIEKQRKDLAERMQGKTQELEGQIKTLEMLLANYEIQHVIGEIEDEIYTREINLLSNTLEATRHELSIIKDASNQLCPEEISVQTPEAPTVAAEVAVEPTPVETVPLETPVEAPQLETPITETLTIEPASIESAPIETPIETMAAEPNPEIESAQVEVPAVEETASIETVPDEVAEAEAAPIEVPVEAPVFEDAPVEEAAPIETSDVEVAMVEEAVPAEEAPIEEALIIDTEEPQENSEAAPELIIEPAVEEQVNMEETETPAMELEQADQVEEATIDDSAEVSTSTEVIEDDVVEQPTIDVPLQAFDVTEHAPVETTLEKVMDPILEPVIEPTIVEEAHVPAHPLEAPPQAPSEGIDETDTDQAAQTDENDESTTE